MKEDQGHTIAFRCSICKEVREVGWIEANYIIAEPLIVHEIPCRKCVRKE